MGVSGKAVVIGVLISSLLYLPTLLGVPFVGLFALFFGGFAAGYLGQKTDQSGVIGGLATGVLSGILIGVILGVFIGFTWKETVLQATPLGEDPQAFLRFFKLIAILMGIIIGIIAGVILGTAGGILGNNLSKRKRG